MLTASSFHRLDMLDTLAFFKRLTVEVDILNVCEQEDLVKQLKHLLV
jgi:hypothetical protein